MIDLIWLNEKHKIKFSVNIKIDVYYDLDDSDADTIRCNEMGDSHTPNTYTSFPANTTSSMNELNYIINRGVCTQPPLSFLYQISYSSIYFKFNQSK